MTAPTSPSLEHAPIATLLFGDLDAELAGTRRTLERFPEGQQDWRPHPKSMPIGALAAHLATLPDFGERILASDALDFAAQPYVQKTFGTTAELLALFDRSVAAMRPLVAATDLAALDAAWTLRYGEQVLVSDRKAPLLRTLLINHMVHHRAQLGVYYRLLDVPVPGLYGPSADEAF